MYQGMLPLCYPSELGLSGMMLLPWFYPIAQNVAQWLEKRAFDGRLCNSVVRHELLYFIHDYKFYCKFFLDFPPFRHYWKRFHRKPRMHYAQVMAWKLLDEAFFDGEEDISEVVRCLNKFFPMSRSRQRRWLEKMWRQSRIL